MNQINRNRPSPAERVIVIIKAIGIFALILIGIAVVFLGVGEFMKFIGFS